MRARLLALAVLPLPLVAFACGGAASQRDYAPPSALTPPPPNVPPPDASASAPAPAAAMTYGVDEAAMDTSVNPCDDFYAFACGTWMKNTPIPDDQPDWMRSFDVIFERNETMLRGILEKDAKGQGGAEAYAQKLGDFYTSCMDESGIEQAGDTSLKSELAKIDGLKDASTLAVALAHLHGEGLSGGFNFSSGQDFKDATQVIGIIEQGGLGLPDRDYYLKDDAKSKEIRDKYVAHVARMLELAGEPAASTKGEAAAILGLETTLAKASLTKVDLRDPKKIYHRIELAGLKKTAPDFPWETYFKEIGVPGITALNVAEPKFFAALSQETRALASPVKVPGCGANDACPKTHLEAMRVYLKWHTLHSAARTLPKRFVDEDFSFKSALTGAPKILPRWKRCVRATDAAMGEALAQPFVKETLGREGKATTEAMIAAIEASMHANLEKLAWMDDATRKKALEKLGLIHNKIGFPGVWRNYDTLDVSRASYFDNVLHADAFETKRQLAKIGKPLDRSEWQMTPPTVNAYYDSSMNEMVFPAGILQPPFYANKSPLAVNYGGIGMVMGHELTHGFDDEGRQFDGNGNLKEWWSPSVGKDFDKRAACVAGQFDEYVAVDDVHVNGKLTLGENIADLGGVKLAFASFKAGQEPTPKSQASKWNPDQQFFLGYAQGWCGNMRKEMLRLLVTTNPHSPPKFRVNGPLSNLPEFAQAFSCKEGSAMVRGKDKRCEVW